MFIGPCRNLIKTDNGITAVDKCIAKIREEHEEVEMAWDTFNRHASAKNLQQLGEELADSITASMTALYALEEKIPGAPEGFVRDCLRLVAAKNHARGYWK